MFLEIGCGKGVATVKMAHENPEINFIAVDEVRHVLAVSIKNAMAEYGSDPVDNLRFTAIDATRIFDTGSRRRTKSSASSSISAIRGTKRQSITSAGLPIRAS